MVSKLEGADVALLTAKVAQYCPITDASTTNGPLNKSTEASIKSVSQSTPQTSAAAVERVKRLISSQPVMLLMKGTPDVPRCGFSSRVVKALQKSGTPFGHFDILSDETVRQTAKVCIEVCKMSFMLEALPFPTLTIRTGGLRLAKLSPAVRAWRADGWM